MRAKLTPCRCKGYPFPHRMFGGKCLANESGPFCGNCGQPCQTKKEDQGIGPYEYWGQRGVDKAVVTVSDCCGDSVFNDAQLRVDYDGDY